MEKARKEMRRTEKASKQFTLLEVVWTPARGEKKATGRQLRKVEDAVFD